MKSPLLVAPAAIAAAVAVIWWLVPPIEQDLGYHLMADRRSLFGVPNAMNVLSNVPFLVVGVLGLAAILQRPAAAAPAARDWVRWPYAALFLGTALTAFGSSYYHLAPDNARLVWDRLPMTVGFMGLLTAVIAERASVRAARGLFVPLLVAGAASVGYWWWSELQGAGDLRLYGLVQFGSLAAILVLVLWTRGRDLDTTLLMGGLGLYGLSKIFEWADAAVFRLGGLVSGHTLKHATAALAVACVVALVWIRNQESGIRNQADI